MTDLSLDLLSGVLSKTFTLPPSYHWSYEPAALNIWNKICFCKGCYSLWEDWIDRGSKLVKDDSYFERAVQSRISEAKSSSDEDYRQTGIELEKYLNWILEKRKKPSCAKTQ